MLGRDPAPCDLSDVTSPPEQTSFCVYIAITRSYDIGRINVGRHGLTPDQLGPTWDEVPGCGARGRPPTVSSCTPASPSTTRPPSLTTWPTWASATSTARRTCRPPRAAPTATTWSTTGGSTANSAAPPRIAGSSTGWPAPASARCSTSCPTTWPSRAGTTPGGGTCSRTARRAATPATSTSTGIRRRRKLADTVLMPVLGDHYGRVLEAGELAVERDAGSFTVRYYDHEAPLSPRTLDGLLGRAAVRAGSADLAELAGRVRPAASRDPDRPGGRGRPAPRQGRAARHARRAVRGQARGGGGHRRRARDAQPRPGRARRAAAPPELPPGLLAHRERGAVYRRFFNIETLVGLRVEDEAVFADTHGLDPRPGLRGTLDGLRVDHVDGLATPRATWAGCARPPAAPTSWSRRSWSRRGPARVVAGRRDTATTS